LNPLFWSWSAVTIATVFGGFLLGGFLTGIDRKLTARMQNRVGPPIVQPFFDVIKLWGKERVMVNPMQLLYANTYLFFSVASLVLLILGWDLLMILFISAFASVALVLGGYSVESPYARIASQREIIQIAAAEPVLVLAMVGMFLVTGDFTAAAIPEHPRPLLVDLPLVFVALLIAIGIKLRKSPFDVSTSAHHAHQELVRGIYTEFAGPTLAVLEVGHWFEMIFFLVFLGLFWAPDWRIAGLLLTSTFILELLVDNISARYTWSWLLKVAWVGGMGLAAVNVAWLYL
jgi:ech hydrogenase subunit B